LALVLAVCAVLVFAQVVFVSSPVSAAGPVIYKNSPGLGLSGNTEDVFSCKTGITSSTMTPTDNFQFFECWVNPNYSNPMNLDAVLDNLEELADGTDCTMFDGWAIAGAGLGEAGTNYKNDDNSCTYWAADHGGFSFHSVTPIAATNVALPDGYFRAVRERVTSWGSTQNAWSPAYHPNGCAWAYLIPNVNHCGYMAFFDDADVGGGSRSAYLSHLVLPFDGQSNFGSPDDPATCQQMSVGWSQSDGMGGWIAFGYTAPTIGSGDDLKITVGLSGSLASAGDVGTRVDISWRNDPSAAWDPIVFFLPGVGGAYPRDVEFVVPDGWGTFIPNEIQIRCAAEGEDPFIQNFGDEIVAGGGYDLNDPGVNGENCYASSGMTLTNPVSWVTGAGRMGVCLVRWLVVPSGDAISESFDGFTEELFAQFPFSFISIAIDFLDDLGTAMTSASGSGCFSGTSSWTFGVGGSQTSVSGDDVCIGENISLTSPQRTTLLAIMGAPILFALLRHAWGMVLGGDRKVSE